MNHLRNTCGSRIATSRFDRSGNASAWMREIGATALFLAFVYGAHVFVGFLAGGPGI